MLTHLKEKLQFVQAENSEQSNHLRSVEAHVAQVNITSLSPCKIILDFREHLSNYNFFKMRLVIENGAHGFFKINIWRTQY